MTSTVIVLFRCGGNQISERPGKILPHTLAFGVETFVLKIHYLEMPNVPKEAVVGYQSTWCSQECWVSFCFKLSCKFGQFFHVFFSPILIRFDNFFKSLSLDSR